MSEIRCPSCGDIFRVPESGVPSHALIHCPWCSDAFTAERLLAALPPAARITDESGAELAVATGEPGDEYSANAQLTDSPDEAPSEADGASDESAAGDYDWSALTQDAEDPALTADESTSVEQEAFAAQPRSWSEMSAAEDEGGDYDYEDEDEDVSEEHPFQLHSSVEPRPLHDYSDDEFADEERSFIPRLRSRGNGSSLKSIVGVIMGGLLSIPLAAFILALLGRPLDLGFWPLDGRAFTGARETRSAAPPAPPIERRNVPENNRQGRSLADDLSRNESLTTDGRRAAAQPSRGEHDRIASAPDRSERAGNAAPADAEASQDADLQSDDFTEPASESVLIPETEDADDSAESSLVPIGPAFDSGEDFDAEVVEAEVAEEETLEPAGVDDRSTTDESSIAGEVDGLSELTAANGSLPVESEDAVARADAVDADQPSASSVDEPFDAAAIADEIIQTITASKATESAEASDQSESLEPADFADSAEQHAPPTPRFSSPELTQAALAADEALDAFESDESLAADVRKQHLTRLFINLAAAGELTEDEDVPQVQALVYRTIDSGLLSELEKAGPRWASLSRRTNDGLLAVGSLRQEGERWLLDWNGPEPLAVEGVEPDQATELPLVLLGKLLEAETPSVRATLLTPTGR